MEILVERLVGVSAFLCVIGCARRDASPASADSNFAALQQRGATAMGVDQYTSSHVFESLPDGGRISLQRDTVDSAGIAAVHAFLAFQRMDHRAAGHDHAGMP